ncbi:unnamed protein product [Moneuplotes crassus]|uniref:Uncharacterized protein n=1 Tax=Euplotes crassus TaxID=5936 RepID=A0AAD1XB02_EUPCR|nr:unnamed protein product [Moneuplotes crassus]
MSTRTRKVYTKETPDFFGAWSLHKSCERRISNLPQRYRKKCRREPSCEDSDNIYNYKVASGLKKKRVNKSHRNGMITIAPPRYSGISYKEKIYKFEKDNFSIPERQEKVMDIFMAVTETCPSTIRRSSHTPKYRRMPSKVKDFSKPNDCYSIKTHSRRRKSRTSNKVNASKTVNNSASLQTKRRTGMLGSLPQAPVLKPSKIKVVKKDKTAKKICLNFGGSKKSITDNSSEKSSLEVSLQPSSKPSIEDDFPESSTVEDDLVKASCFRQITDNKCSLESTIVHEKPNKVLECINRANRLLNNEFTKRQVQNIKNGRLLSLTEKIPPSGNSKPSKLNHSFTQKRNKSKKCKKRQTSSKYLKKRGSKKSTLQKKSLLVGTKNHEKVSTSSAAPDSEFTITKVNRQAYQGFVTDDQPSDISFCMEEESEEATKCPECKRFFMAHQMKEHIKLCQRVF